MARSKLNKITKLHIGATTPSKKDMEAEEAQEGPGAEASESPEEQAREDRTGTEKHPKAATKVKKARGIK
jgi:hypothetical protein